MEIKNCVLVNVTISQWDANSLDRTASKQIAASNGVAKVNMCRLRKSLLPKSDALRRVLSAIAEARTFHYNNTHAWVHDGPRILTRANFDTYMKEMRRIESDFKTSVLEFIVQFETSKVEAKKALGSLYKEEDYPQAKDLARRYKYEISVLPIASASTLIEFGMDVDEARAHQLKMEADVDHTLAQANRKMWQDLYARLETLHNKLSDSKAYVQEETINKVRHLSTLYPRINVTEDKGLDAMSLHLMNTLDGVTSQGVKVNAGLRDRVVSDTRQALAAMQALMHGQEYPTPAAPLDTPVSRHVSV